MKAAFLFPGQGSQFVGMGKSLWESTDAGRAVWALADEVLGEPLSTLAFEGPESRLRETRYTQPAILAHSLGALALLEGAGIKPELVAGHSLGEFSALVAAGVLDPRTAFEIVKVRADLMFRAGEQRPGAMAAVLGLEEGEVAQACRELEAVGLVVPANLNCPGQVVVSGEVAAVDKLIEVAVERGAKRAVRLPVSGAFHSPLMKAANEGLAAALDRAEYRDAKAPVVVNATAQLVSAAAELRAASKAQLMSPVRWEASMHRMIEEGVEVFIEIGPGNVLRGLLRKIAGKFPCLSVEGPDDLAKVVAEVGSGGSS